MRKESSDDAIHDNLSAALDNQASDQELESVLKQISENPQLLKKAYRYQIIKDTLKNRDNPFLDVDLSEQIHNKIKQEESLSQESSIPNNHIGWFDQIKTFFQNQSWVLNGAVVSLSIFTATFFLISNFQSNDPNNLQIALNNSNDVENQIINTTDNINSIKAMEVTASFNNQESTTKPSQKNNLESISKKQFKIYYELHNQHTSGIVSLIPDVRMND